MAAEGSTRAVVTALAANLGIAAAKFVAAAITGSASMLAEGVHSVADSTNQALLLLGGARAKRVASARHPFGYARERYIYAFIVAIVLFSLGGLYALFEGAQKVTHPHELTSPLVAIGVLVFAICLEGWALRTAAIEANKTRERASWLEFVRRAKAPEIPVILLEDTGAVIGLVFALLGVGLTWITGNAIFDGVGTLLIGGLLTAIAVLLATETKSLLVGEAASESDVMKIERALLDHPLIDQVIHLRTMHLGPDELLVAAKIGIGREDDAARIATAIDEAETAIRAAVHIAKIIYLEPDIFIPAHATPLDRAEPDA